MLIYYISDHAIYFAKIISIYYISNHDIDYDSIHGYNDITPSIGLDISYTMNYTNICSCIDDDDDTISETQCKSRG